MRKSVSDRIIYALAAAFAVFFAISSCVKQDKILLLDKDNSSLSVFAKLFDDGVDYLSGVATKSAKAKEDTDPGIVKDDDVDARLTLHETLIETLDIFVKVESASQTEHWLKVYHLDKNTSGVILNTSDPGGLMDKARQVLAKYWPDEGYDPNIAYHIYVTANNPHTHNCAHTSDHHYRAGETSVPANLQELMNLSTYDAATDKYYTDGTIPERTNRTNTKAFLMDGDIIWSPKPEEGDQVWDVDLKRAVSKVLMNITMSDEFKQDSLAAAGWTAGEPMWRYVHFGFEVADIAGGTYELDKSEVGGPWNNAPFKIGSLTSMDGDRESYTYQILTYTAPFKWTDYSDSPYMLVSIAYTYEGADPEILDKYPSRRRTCYYHIPICDAEVVAPEGLKRNNIYITDAEIGSFGSENEELEAAELQLRIEYHVVPWTVTNIDHEATVVKLSDIKYLTVYPTTYILKGDDVQSVDFDWYASVSIDDGRFVDLDLNSVEITYVNYLGNTINITGSQSGTGTADHIYKTPANPDGTTDIVITSYAPNGSLGANGESTVISLTRDGIIRVSSEALKSRAVKTIKFTVKLTASSRTKEIVIKHFPLDNIQSFTGSWSSRWDGINTNTEYSFNPTADGWTSWDGYEDDIECTLDEYNSAEPAHRSTSTISGTRVTTRDKFLSNVITNEDRAAANSEENAVNGYWGTDPSDVDYQNYDPGNATISDNWDYWDRYWGGRLYDDFNKHKYANYYTNATENLYYARRYYRSVAGGTPGTGDWVDWENHTGTVWSQGIYTAKVYNGGYCRSITGPNSYNGTSGTNLTNNHMYVIQITSSSDSHALGKPVLDGNYQSQDHVVSPAFMIASQLGAVTSTTSPTAAATHCGTYMEVGTDGTRYVGWRLPTAEEINVIIGYQNGEYTGGVTMVEVLGGRYYWTLNGESALVPTGTDGTANNAYVRCVRDLTLAEIAKLNGN